MQLTNIQEFMDVMAEIDYQKKINPLGFHKNLLMQKRFTSDPSKRKAIFGGNRSGKTEPVAEYVIQKSLRNPCYKSWACAETFPDSVAIQQKKVWDLLPKNEIEYGNYDEINGFPNRKLLFKNGSMITFKSYDQKREAFQSDDLDLIWNDEEPPFDIYKEQKMRLLDRNGEMILSMTSLKGITDLIDDIFDDCTIIESQYAPLLGKDLPRVAEKNGIRFYFLWTTENPHIDQNRLAEEIRFMSKDEILSRIYGVPVNLSGRIYPTFNKDIHVIDFEDIPKHGCLLWNVLDPHDRKPWAMAWWAIHVTGTCYQVSEYPFERNFNEIQFDDNTYDEYVEIIRTKEAELKAIFGCGVSKRLIDPNFGNKTIQLAERQGGQSRTTPKEELKKRGLEFIDSIDALEAGHLKVRQMLYYEKKNNEIIFQPKILFSNTCQNTITHMTKYSHKDIMTPSGDVKDRAGVVEKYKDFADLTRYFCMADPKYIKPKQFIVSTGKVY